MTTAYLNRIATAVPEHDVHDAFVVFAEHMLADPRLRPVFRRMVSRAGIAHRYSSLDPQKDLGQSCRTTRMSWCAYLQTGAVHAALSGDAGAEARALVPGVCRWRGGEPDYRVRMKMKKTCMRHLFLMI